MTLATPTHSFTPVPTKPPMPDQGRIRVLVAEDEEHLGERLSLPPDFEYLRDRVEPLLTPLPDPRATTAR